MTQYSDVMNFPSAAADNINFFIIIFTKIRMAEISFQPTNFAKKIY